MPPAAIGSYARCKRARCRGCRRTGSTRSTPRTGDQHRRPDVERAPDGDRRELRAHEHVEQHRRPGQHVQRAEHDATRPARDDATPDRRDHAGDDKRRREQPRDLLGVLVDDERIAQRGETRCSSLSTAPNVPAPHAMTASRAIATTARRQRYAPAHTPSPATRVRRACDRQRADRRGSDCRRDPRSRLAGPVVLSSAAVTGSMPCARSRRWSSRTSANSGACCTRRPQPGLNVSMFFSNMLEESDGRRALLSDRS